MLSFPGLKAPGVAGWWQAWGQLLCGEAAVSEPRPIDPDAEEVRLTLSGDDEAYGRLIRRHENRIARQMWRFNRDPDGCAELVQDVFVEAYYSLKNFRGEAPFAHWLSRIASRVGYRHWQERERQPATAPLNEWEGATPPSDAPETRQAAELLHRLLDRLGAEDRLVLTLHYFEDLTAREIGERLEWSRDMVKMRIFRARQRLKELIERENLREDLL